MKKFFILIFASIFMEAPLHAQKYSLQSPDGHIALTISNQEQLTYSVQLDGKSLIAWYRFLDIVCSWDTVVDIHDPLGAEACQVAIACSVATKEIV